MLNEKKEEHEKPTTCFLPLLVELFPPSLTFFNNIFDNSHEQDPVIRPLAEQDNESLLKLLPEIPLWVKNPDYDRVCICVY